MAHQVLAEAIIALSQAKNWDKAVPEWKLLTIFISSQPETCLCGHFPTKELCVLYNTTNQNRATVGNCCVKKFMGLPSDRIFQSLKKLNKDATKAANEDTIQFVYERGIITPKDYEFYLQTHSKRNDSLSVHQRKYRLDLNRKILQAIPLYRDPRSPFSWAKQALNGYEVSRDGDKQFSPQAAFLPAGTTVIIYKNGIIRPYTLKRSACLEEINQVGLRGHKTMYEGFKMPVKNDISPQMHWSLYLSLWRVWAGMNEHLMEEAASCILTNAYAFGEINSARALACLLNDRIGRQYNKSAQGADRGKAALIEQSHQRSNQ